ncbi:SpeD S-adenosylmethionine decarboxylase [uncultured Caudovirales phage]|uniref:SpeD S-adenosylmethionine decarboxylase n=1 Tax=uncultured Caudovirales phage TaxID=2100421 RepID=A0A6J5KYB9_9CAUD|nr:SpeD S-adenosylmethionine decarboxylase [uncultured Caudovirales phage]
MDDKMHTWGYHLTLDCAGCDLQAIRDGETIAKFAAALVKNIDMKAYGEPQVVHFAAHDPTKGGYTLVQLIETSNITAHFVDASGEMFLDVFSCKEFEMSDVVDVVNDWFKPQSAVVNTFVRGTVAP